MGMRGYPDCTEQETDRGDIFLEVFGNVKGASVVAILCWATAVRVAEILRLQELNRVMLFRLISNGGRLQGEDSGVTTGGQWSNNRRTAE